jgi:hypothetical protein
MTIKQAERIADLLIKKMALLDRAEDLSHMPRTSAVYAKAASTIGLELEKLIETFKK